MNTDRVEVIRWPPEKLPDKALLRSILADKNLHPYMGSNGPGDVYGAHSHSYHKVIYVARGSITFGLPKKTSIRPATQPAAIMGLREVMGEAITAVSTVKG